MPRKTHPFWRFSLRVYAHGGVEQACLALQQAGADVNLLLFCCWQGRLGKRLTKQSLRKAMRAVRVLQQQVVQPLRQARCIIKLGLPGVAPALGAALRRHIAGVELDAEYLEQLVLAQYGEASPLAPQPAETTAEENLTRYLELLGIAHPTSIRRHARVLLDASA